MEKIYFELPDTNKNNVCFKDLHYYKWLQDYNVENVHSVTHKRKYIHELGFDNKIHKIKESDFRILKACELYYWRQTDLYKKLHNQRKCIMLETI